MLWWVHYFMKYDLFWDQSRAHSWEQTSSSVDVLCNDYTNISELVCAASGYWGTLENTE